MEMMNRAIEDAADFRGMMDKLKANTEQQMRARQILDAALSDEEELDGRRFAAVLDRQPGENRAEHRARLKMERRQAKTKKAVA